MSLQNVTIDDGANSTAAQILYSPPLCNGSGWTVSEGQGVGGSYRFCTSSNKSVTPSASLSFTGVGVYYMSPYFAGDVMSFTLDGVESQLVNLSAPAGTTNNASASSIVWSAVNLNNTQHLLELHPNNGSRTLNVDAFIITQVASNATATGSTAGNVTQGAPTAANPLLGLPNLLPPVQSAGTTRLSMGLGITFGTLSFLIFLGIAIFLGRRTRDMKQNFHASKPLPSIHPVDEDPDVIDTRAAYTQDSYQQSSPVSPEAAVPMRMLPSVAHGSFTTQPDFEVGDARSVGDTHGRASPALSNTHLISKRASSSSQGHGESQYEAAAPSSGAAAARHHPPLIKFEPVRMSNAPAGPRVRSASGSAQSHGHGAGDGSASVSRNTTFASRLEPVRGRTVESSAPSAFSASAFGGASARDHESGAVSRSATMFNSTRFEPVRKGYS